MIKIGILGAGYVACFHCMAAARHRQAKVVHIADIRYDVARKLADKYGIGQVSNDPAKVLADDTVDTVIIALPTFLHFKWLIRCAKADKQILTEKPLCRTVSEGQRVIRACASHGVRLAVGYQRRFSPARIKARKLIQSGMLGRPVTWTISTFGPRPDFYKFRGPTGKWVWDINNGGYIMDCSIHDFDFACWVLGKPAKMFAQSRTISHVVTAPTQANAHISFERGDNLIYSGAWQEGNFGAGSAPNSVVGPEGTIIFHSDLAFTWHYAPNKKKQFNWDPDHFSPNPTGWMTYKQLDSFIQGKHNPSLTTGEEALNSLWISEKIIAAGSDGQMFQFIPKGSGSTANLQP